MFPSPAATRTIQRDCNKESTMISESATILIVEDEQDIRELLAYNLEKEGYATVQAADGKEGLERSAANSNATPARCASPSSC